MFIGWAFELSPEGLKKTAPADGPEEFRPLGPSDFVLMASVAVVVSVAGVQLFWPPSGMPRLRLRIPPLRLICGRRQKQTLLTIR